MPPGPTKDGETARREAVARGAARVLDAVLGMREEMEEIKKAEGAFGGTGHVDALDSSVLTDLALEAIPRKRLEEIVEAADHATNNREKAEEIAAVLVTVAKRLAVFM